MTQLYCLHISNDSVFVSVCVHMCVCVCVCVCVRACVFNFSGETLVSKLQFMLVLSIYAIYVTTPRFLESFQGNSLIIFLLIYYCNCCLAYLPII